MYLDTYFSRSHIPGRMRDTTSSRYNKFVGLRSILKLPEVKVQVTEGDLCVEDLESAWLEACAVKVRRLGLACEPSSAFSSVSSHILSFPSGTCNLHTLFAFSSFDNAGEIHLFM